MTASPRERRPDGARTARHPPRGRPGGQPPGGRAERPQPEPAGPPTSGDKPFRGWNRTGADFETGFHAFEMIGPFRRPTLPARRGDRDGAGLPGPATHRTHQPRESHRNSL